MPEGDTVHRAAARLHAAFAGDRLVHGRLNVPAHATADLAGAEVLEVVPRGKHLLLRMELGGAALTLHSHLRMDGAWVLVPAARRAPVPAHEVRAELRSATWTALGRLLGEVDLVRTTDEHLLVGHLGPDLLDPQVDLDEAAVRVGAVPDRAVAEALLDQRNVAGLGNELVAEVCFLRGVHPWQPVGSVELAPLLRLAVRLIRANAPRAVRSSTGDLRPGRTSYVYGRAGRPCRRCGTEIRTRSGQRLGGEGRESTRRATWWCPRCQPGPGGPGAENY